MAGSLALSLSAMDAVGHAFGPDSWESWDNLLRLDRMLAGLMELLDRQVGKHGYAVVVSSDHGGVSLPELAGDARLHPWCHGGTPDRWNRPCQGGERIDQYEVAHELDAATRRALGVGPWIAGVADPYVFFTDAAKQLPANKRSVLMKTIVSQLEKHPGIERAVDVRDVPSTCPPRLDESQDALVCRAVRPGTSGDVYMIPRAGSFFDPEYDRGKGSSHGTPNVFDRSVPMLAYAPGRVKAGRLVDEVTDAAAFAHTVSALLGIAPPEHAREGISLAERPANR